MRVVMVAAYGDNRVIGDDGAIPWRIPEDFAHFKKVTLGHTLVMGRLTWDSIGRPLPGRRTVVVTRQRGWSAGFDDVLVAHSVPDALSTAAGLARESGEGIVVAGGGQVYDVAMPYATEQILTEVHLSPAGDATYPEFPAEEWREVRRDPRPDLGLDWVWWQRRGTPQGLA